MLSKLEQLTFAERLQELGRGSDVVWALATATGILFTLIAAYLFPYPASASGKCWAYAGLCIRAGLYLWAGDALRGRGGETLQRLFRLGLVAGVFELLVDWWLIHGVSRGQLIYLTGNDVVLLGSPIWMPLAWACVIVELGYPMLRVFRGLYPTCGLVKSWITASLVAGVAAALTVGLYEYFAYRAGWWKYAPARVMLGPYCAVYIPLGEFFMFLALLPVAARAIIEESRPIAAAITGGARFAIAIAAGYGLAYLLLESGWLWR